jgi:hypothetical protein
MKSYIALSACLWLLPQILCGQPIQTPEECRLQLICDQLCRMAGRENMTVVIKHNEPAPASTDGVLLQISKPNCYDIIMRMDASVQDDAFASIIGHELSHKLVGQDGSIRCFAGDVSCGGGQAECDMDFYGLMLAHIAGYNQAAGIWDQLIKNLDIQSGGIARKKQDEITRSRVTAALGPFELGNYFSMLSDDPYALEAAVGCYETCRYNLQEKDRPLPVKVKIRQIDYQIGLVKLKQALYYAGIKCQFPFETIDPSFLDLRRGDVPIKKKEALEALYHAERYLQQSLEPAQNWPEAHMALLCVDLARSKINEKKSGPFSNRSRLYPAMKGTNTVITSTKWQDGLNALDGIWKDLSANKDCPPIRDEGSSLKCPLNVEEIRAYLTGKTAADWSGVLSVKHHYDTQNNRELWEILLKSSGTKWLILENTSGENTYGDQSYYQVRQVDHNQYRIDRYHKSKKFNTWIFRK